MTSEVLAPIIDDSNDNAEQSSRSGESVIGKKAVRQIIEDPRDFYVSWGFTD